jgi:hypothetical protein
MEIRKPLLQVVVYPYGPPSFPLLSLERRLRRVTVCFGPGQASDPVQRVNVLIAEKSRHAFHSRGLCNGQLREPGLLHPLRQRDESHAEQGRRHHTSMMVALCLARE